MPLALASVIAAALFLASSAQAVTISCGSMGKELELCRTAAQAWSRQTGKPVEVLAAPSGSGDRLGSYQLLLAAGSRDIDVLAVDTTWPGVIGDFLVDLKPLIAAKALREHFASFIENDTVKGRLVALPWFIDAGVLYYRRDLLAKYGERVPETWRQLEASAARIQAKERAAGQARFWGYVFEGRAYEGLTCNALEWVASEGAHAFLDPATGRVAAEDEPALARAFGFAASLIGRVSPPGTLNAQEEEARGVFQSGGAAFMRNWPYAFRLAQGEDSPVRGKVGIAPLPRGEGPGARHVATLGGWSLAVSKHSRDVEGAVSLALYLASAREQKRRLLEAGLSPTMPALYHDPELLRARPELAELARVFKLTVARPSRVTGTRYNRASAEIWDLAHRVLERALAPDAAARELRATLDRVGREGRW